MKIDNEVKPLIDLITVNVKDDAMKVILLNACHGVIGMKREVYSAYCKLVYDRQFSIEPIRPEDVMVMHLKAMESNILSNLWGSEQFSVAEISGAIDELIELI